jgi:hypothetical protein
VGGVGSSLAHVKRAGMYVRWADQRWHEVEGAQKLLYKVIGSEQLGVLLSDILGCEKAVVEEWEVLDDNFDGDEGVELRLEDWGWRRSCRAAASQVVVAVAANQAYHSRGGAQIEAVVDGGEAERAEELADSEAVQARWMAF